MAYPILKPNSTWFTPNVSTITRSTIITINIVDTYTPADATAIVDFWDASVAQDGSIMCYVEGTALTIAGNGSGKILTNEDASSMFSDINKVDYFKLATTINGLNVLDTSHTTDMSYMFFRSGLLSIDVSSFNVSKVKTMEHMFASDKNNDGMKVTEIHFGSNFDMSSCENTALMFRNCQNLTNVDIENINPLASKSFYAMFYRCYGLTTIDLSKWEDTSACEDMSYMFGYNPSLISVNISNLNTKNVKTFKSMFSNCENLSGLSVANFDTSSCEDMSFMFYGCKGVKTIDFDNWDVSKVKTFDHFMAHSFMENYDVSKWNVTSACTNLNGIFHSTTETYIDVTGWDTSNVIAFNQLCDGMWYLQKIDGLETWDTSKGVCFGEMFRSCRSLKELDLSSFDTRKADEGTPVSTNGANSYGLWFMLDGCTNLEKLSLGENFTRYGNGEISQNNYAVIPSSVSGYWYTIDGAQYAPADVPDLTAATYFASALLAKHERNKNMYISLNGMEAYHAENVKYINEAVNAPKTELILSSSIEGSTKKFKLTIDDNGTLTVSEIVV
jgi:surface protein